MALLIYAVTLFVSAFLLFLVQPIIGAKILPKLGGTPSVWNTCVVFFQLTLLVGYGYTHFATKLPVRRQILIHCLLLFLPFLILLPHGPFGVEDFKPVTGGNPTVATLWLLASIVGIPFFVVSTTAPLLQKWFGNTGHPAAKDPYFLYGASNLGSMLSLLLYPLLFEPLFGLNEQSWVYTFGYVALVIMVVVCAGLAFLAAPTVQLPGAKKAEDVEKVPSLAPEPPPTSLADVAAAPVPSATSVTATPPAPAAPKPAMASGIKKGGKKGKGRDLAKMAPTAASTMVATPSAAAALAATATTPNIAKPGFAASDPDEITWLRRFRWIGLAAVPSSLMLGVITYMSTDITAIPLFWVVPLALYLLSFILVFMRWPINWLEQAHTYVLYLQPIALAVLALFIAIANASIIVYIGIVMLVAFMFTALTCHGEMAKDRPSAKHLTEFYLWMSVGGAVGGLFNAIIAPVIFKDFGVVEFGLALIAAGLLRPILSSQGWIEKLLNNMSGSSGASHRHVKGAKKVSTSMGDSSGLTLGLDFGIPAVLLVLLGVLLWGVFQPRGEGAARLMFMSVIVPLALAASFVYRPLRFGLTLASVLLLTGIYLNSGAVEFQTRTYFGVLRVRRSAEAFGNLTIPYTSLTHGTTHHGMALEKLEKGPDLSRVATTYYHRQGPVGICMERFNWFRKSYEVDNFQADARMPVAMVGMGVPNLGVNWPIGQLVNTWSEPSYAVIGMGTATMASYGRPYQTCHFYEIDEQIRLLSIPADPNGRVYFGYVKAAKKRGTNVHILMGDARLRMAMPWVPEDMTSADPATIPFDARGGPSYFYHLMVVDAFSSDAIPKHLITKEAIEMYFKHLVQGRWGPWIEVNPKNPNEDVNGNQLDSTTVRGPRFQWEEKKVGDKVVEKRAWYPGGQLCVHTSNRHLRLVPVVTDTSKVCAWEDLYDRDADGKPKIRTGLVAIRGHDSAPGMTLGIKEDIGHSTSEWVIVARDIKDLPDAASKPEKYDQWIKEVHDKNPRAPSSDPYWTPQTATGTYVWTDDHSNLMAVFRWPWRHGD